MPPFLTVEGISFERLILCSGLQAGRSRHSALWRRVGLDLHKPAHGLLAAVAAHVGARLERGANSRPLGVTENLAPLLLVKLHTSHARRFPLGHSWDRAGNGRRRTARATKVTALHLHHFG